MPKYGAGSFSIYLIGGYNLLAAKIKGSTHKTDVILEPSHGLGDSWGEVTPTGDRTATLTQDGAFFEDSANGMHIALKDAPQTSRVGLVGWRGNTIGATVTGFAGILEATYEVLGSLFGLTKANVTHNVSGRVEDGVLLLEHLQKTANWTSTSVDNGASTAFGGAAYLEVSEFAGFTGVAIKVRHSADNAVFADLATFANVTGGPTAERVAVVPGTVNRYLQTTGVVTGSGTITPAVAFARHTS
jgi:hypothetical protein